MQKVSKSSHDNEHHDKEAPTVHDGLLNKFDIVLERVKQSEPVEDFEPHEEHSPRSELNDRWCAEVFHFENDVDVKGH